MNPHHLTLEARLEAALDGLALAAQEHTELRARIAELEIENARLRAAAAGCAAAEIEMENLRCERAHALLVGGLS